jgi:hypothetical protein
VKKPLYIRCPLHRQTLAHAATCCAQTPRHTRQPCRPTLNQFDMCISNVDDNNHDDDDKYTIESIIMMLCQVIIISSEKTTL